MTPPFKKNVLGAASVTLFFLLTFLLFGISFKANLSNPVYLNLAGFLILSYCLAAALAWMAFRMAIGITITLTSMVLVLLVGMRIGLAGYPTFVLPLFLTAVLGILHSKNYVRVRDLHQLKLEKLSEDMNILSNEIEEKKRGIASIEEKLKRYSLLKDVVDSFSAQLMLDDIKKIIMDKTMQTIGKEGRLLLFLVDTDRQELMLSASRSVPRVAAKKGDLFDRWVFKNRKALMIEDITTDFRFSADDHRGPKHAFRSLISTALVSGDKVIGILRLDSPKELTYSQDDLRLLDIIADLGAVALENAFLYARTQELAIRDSLTGLAVRRYFLERFQAEVKRAAMNKAHISILMLDIDYFKDYNDKFGHAAGDIVLKHLARTVSSMISEGDIVARYGGEEMIVMLYGRSKKEAALEAEDIRKAIKDSPITLRRHAAQVTVSIGVSTYPEDATTTEGLIKTADDRLYKAKARGRNRVCSA